MNTQTNPQTYGRQSEANLSLSVSGLSAWHGSRLIVKDVTLEVPTRRITAIIGPSGSGKSTFLRCLNRMHELAPGAKVAGHVLIGGHDIYGPGVNPVLVRQHIGMVFQRPNPLPTRSIYENVALGPRLMGRPRANLDEVVERSLRQAALWDVVKDRLQARAGALSGGEQQRLCIARALAGEPKVLLMDEPCSSLDPNATYQIEELLRALKEQYIIVLVTHNMAQASRVSNQTVFVLDGELVECGPTNQIFTNPHDPRTEAYVTGRFG